MSVTVDRQVGWFLALENATSEQALYRFKRLLQQGPKPTSLLQHKIAGQVRVGVKLRSLSAQLGSPLCPQQGASSARSFRSQKVPIPDITRWSGQGRWDRGGGCTTDYLPRRGAPACYRSAHR